MRSSKDGNITGEAGYGGIFTLKDGEELNHTDSSRFQKGGSRKVRAASRRLTGSGTLDRKREFTCTHTTRLHASRVKWFLAHRGVAEQLSAAQLHQKQYMVAAR